MYNYDYGYDYSTYGDGYYAVVDSGDDYVTSVYNPYLNSLMDKMPIISVISLVIGIFVLIGTWKMFKKAGKAGWPLLIPGVNVIYYIIVLIQISGLSLWYLLLLLIPFVNIYAVFKIYIEVAHKFGKGTGFGVLSVFFSFVCIPILGFGKAVYKTNEDRFEPIKPVFDNPEANSQNPQNMTNNNVVDTNVNAPAAPFFVPTNDVNNNLANTNMPVQNSSVVANTPQVEEPMLEVKPAEPIPAPSVEPVSPAVEVNTLNAPVVPEVPAVEPVAPVESVPVTPVVPEVPTPPVVEPVAVPEVAPPVVEPIPVVEPVPQEVVIPEATPVVEPIPVAIEATNKPVVPKEDVVIPEMQSIPDMVLNTNAMPQVENNVNQMPEIPEQKNITDTMSLNELLADIDKESK